MPLFRLEITGYLFVFKRARCGSALGLENECRELCRFAVDVAVLNVLVILAIA